MDGCGLEAPERSRVSEDGSPNSPRVRVLLTDGDARACLALTRSLGQRHHVFVGAPGRRSLAGSSRFAAARVAVPDPMAGARVFAEAVAREARNHRIDFVLPVTDAACRALLPQPRDLGATRLLAPPWPCYEALSDKGRVAVAAARQGLDVPRGGLARGPAEALAEGRALGFPIFVKPLWSVDSGPDDVLVKRGVRRAGSEIELRELLRGLEGVQVLVQESVPGRGEGLSLLRWEGRTRAVFAHRRLREKPPSGGVSVLSESIPADPARVRAVEAILEELGYEGLAMAEFKSDGQRAWLMEFNARPWGSIQLAIDAGVDFPALLLDCALGRPPEGPQPYAEGRRLRWCLGDLDHAMALARGAADASGRRGLRAAAGVLLTRTGPRSRLELLRREDPRPFARALARWLRRRPV